MSDQNRYDVFLRNDGNTALNYSVSGHDYTGKLAFTGEKVDASLPPGREETVTLGIRLKQRPILGALYYIPFEVHIGTGGAPSQVKTSLFEVRPLIPVWLLALLPFLFLCILLPFIRPAVIDTTITPTATVTKEMMVSPSPTATAPAPATASATPSPAATGRVSPTPTPSATPSPTLVATATATVTPSPTVPTATATPTPSATSTQTVTPVVVTRQFSPLSFSVTVTWRLDPRDPSWAIATVVITASGGDGNYTYYRDDILQIGLRFEYYWRACQTNPVTFRVDSGDGQSARIELPEHAPCP